MESIASLDMAPTDRELRDLGVEVVMASTNRDDLLWVEPAWTTRPRPCG